MTLSARAESKVSKGNNSICFNVINENSQTSLLQSLGRNIEWTAESNVQIDHIGLFPGRSQYLNFPNFNCFTCTFYKIWNSKSHKYSAAKTHLRHLKCTHLFLTNDFFFISDVIDQMNIYIRLCKNINNKFHVSYSGTSLSKRKEIWHQT